MILANGSRAESITIVPIHSPDHDVFAAEIDNTSPRYGDQRWYLSLILAFLFASLYGHCPKYFPVFFFLDTRQNSEQVLLLSSIMSSVIGAWMTQCPFLNNPAYQRPLQGVTEQGQAAQFSWRAGLLAWLPPDPLVPFQIRTRWKNSNLPTLYHLMFWLLPGTDFL